MDPSEQSLEPAAATPPTPGCGGPAPAPRVIPPPIDAVTAARVRALEPIRRLPAERQSRILVTGEVLELAPEASLELTREADERVYFLLDGELAFTQGTRFVQRLGADRPEALLPLNGPSLGAGGETQSIVAISPARVFSVAAGQLASDDGAVAVPPAPAAAYADTLSGQELAALVDRIEHERRTFAVSNQAAAEAMDPAAGERLERTSYTVDVDRLLGETTIARPVPAVSAEPPVRGAPHDALGVAFADLESRLRAHLAAVRAAERSAFDARLQRRMQALRERAVEELKRKLVKLRSRDRDLLAAKERALRERYAELARITHRITHQKAQIQQARRQLEDKLRAAEEIHLELSRIGQAVTRQLDDLDGLMGEEGAAEGATPASE